MSASRAPLAQVDTVELVINGTPVLGTTWTHYLDPTPEEHRVVLRHLVTNLCQEALSHFGAIETLDGPADEERSPA